MPGVQLCPVCHAKSLKRQSELIILQPYARTKYGNLEASQKVMKVKPWVCSHCGVVMLYKLKEDE